MIIIIVTAVETSNLTKFPLFMEIEVSLAYSEKYANELYHETDESSLHTVSLRLVLILSRDGVTIDGVWIGNWIY
jgi:hypothetical protein